MAIKRTISVRDESSGSSSKRLKRSNSISKPFAPMRKKKPKQYGQVGPEMKFLDTQSLNNAAATTGVVVSMNTLAQGLTNITRIGNKIQIKSVAVRGQYQTATQAIDTSQPNSMVWSIVLDKEPEAAAIASVNQIYTGNDVLDFNNINESDRFVILATGDANWPGQGQLSGVGAFTQPTGITGMFQRFVKCDIATKYTGTTAAQSTFGTNQLLFVLRWKNADANHLTDVFMRIRFTDE